MAVRTRAQLNADADSALPDNTSGDISPADVRGRIKDLADSARLAEDLGGAAALDVGTTSGTVAAGDDARITGAAQKSANLSDLENAATAFGNIKQAATDAATGVVELATAAEILAGTAGALAVTAVAAKDALALATPSGAANWTPDWSAFGVADWNVTANRTLGNPTSVIVGTTRYVFIRSNSGTQRTITFGSNFKGDLPTLDDVTNTKWYLLSLVAYSATHIVVTAVEASP